MFSGFAKRYILPRIIAAKGKTIIAASLVFVTSATYIATLEAIRGLLQVAEVGRANFSPNGMAAIFFGAGARSPETLFVAIAMAILVLAVSTSLGVFFRDYVFELLALEVSHHLKEQLFSRLVRLPLKRFIDLDHGVLMKRLIHDTGQMRLLVIDAILFRIADILFIFLLVIYMVVLELRLAIISLAVVTTYFSVAFWSALQAKPRLRRVDESQENLSSAASDCFSRFLDIRSNNREHAESERFRTLSTDESRVRRHCYRWLVFDKSLTGFLYTIGPAVITIIGSWLVLQDQLSIDTLLAVTVATSLLYKPVNDLSGVPMTLQRVAVSIRNLAALFCEVTEEEAQRFAGICPLRIPATGENWIEIKNLTFGYSETGPQLRIQLLQIRSGQKVAIIGPSGSGKTTLLRILYGLMPDYGGDLLLGGAELRTLSLAELRPAVGLMTQESVLFAGTLRQNLLYGLPEGTIPSEEELWTALCRADIDSHFKCMREGLDAPIQPMATNLSVGQRRRICLARVLLKRPKLLLLDEPLAGVAPQERRYIVSSLVSNAGSATVLVATHNEEILERMDLVVYLDCAFEQRGSRSQLVTFVAGVGRHAELMSDAASEYKKFVGLEQVTS